MRRSSPKRRRSGQGAGRQEAEGHTGPGHRPGSTFTYQWLRNGKAIKGATEATYKLRARTRARRSRCGSPGPSPGYDRHGDLVQDRRSRRRRRATTAPRWSRVPSGGGDWYNAAVPPDQHATSPGSSTSCSRGSCAPGCGPTRRTAAGAPSRRPRSTRSPGCWSTCRWPTSTGPSTTPCRPRWPTTRGPGARVKVRFAGQDVDGFVLARAAATEHDGPLAPLRRVVSAEPVLAPAGRRARRGPGRAVRRHPVRRAAAGGARAARHHREGGLRRRRRRHRRTTPARPRPPGPTTARRRPSCATSPPGARRARSGAPRPAPTGRRWSPTPWRRPSPRGRGALVVRARRQGRRPGRRRADRGARARASTSRSPPTPGRRGATATSWRSPRARAGSWSAPAPRRSRRSHDLGLVVIWDDGDDLHAEPRAPYPHTREVLLLRAEREGAAALVGGFAPHRRGGAAGPHRLGPRARPPPREVLRERVTVAVAGADEHALARDPLARAARMPTEVHRAIRDALATGPVLVQTPRSGYAAALACERCRTPARCPACTGPLALAAADRAAGTAAGAAPSTRRGPARSAATAGCGRRSLGEARTAEELGRAFPGTVVRTSRRRPGAGRRRRRAGDRGRHPGRRAGRRGRLRRGRAARHLAGAGPARPARRRGGAAPLGQRGRPGPPRRPRGRRSATRPTRRCRRWCAGTRPGSPRREAARAARGAPAAGVPAGDHHRRARAPSTTRSPCCRARRRRGARPGRRSADGESGSWSGCPARTAPTLSRALGELQRVRSARKLDAVRIQVDPIRAAVTATPRLDRGHPAHPPVRRPGPAPARRRGRRLRQGAAQARRRTSPTPCSTRPAPGSRRRRSAWGCGSSPGTSTARSATWSTRCSSSPTETQDGPEGCLSIPGLTFDCRRALSVVASGFDMHGEPVDDRGLRAAGPGDPARDRPPRRRAVHRPARHRRPARPR